MICEICEDTGWRYFFDDDPLSFPKMGPCNCAAAKRLRYRGIPDESIGWTFNNFPAALGTKISVIEGEKVMPINAQGCGQPLQKGTSGLC